MLGRRVVERRQSHAIARALQHAALVNQRARAYGLVLRARVADLDRPAIGCCADFAGEAALIGVEGRGVRAGVDDAAAAVRHQGIGWAAVVCERVEVGIATIEQPPRS